MKMRFAALLLGLSILSFTLLRGPGPSPRATATAEPEDAVALSAVRGLANYLDRAPPRVVRRLAGPGFSGLGLPIGDEGMRRIELTESRIAARYPVTETGALIRHFVALSLDEIDTDYRPELSRIRVISELLPDAGAAVAEVEAALVSLPERGEAAEKERAALVRLAAQLGTDSAALPAAEAILADEISRQSGLDVASDEARLVGLVDSYALLVSDPRRQADFVRAGMLSQQEPRLRHLLETCLDNLVRRVDLTQAQDAGDGAG